MSVTVVVLCSVPVAVQAWPVGDPGVDVRTLHDRINASATQPYQGYAQSSASMGLPELPRLRDVTALAGGTTSLRTWYAGRDRWRVDLLDAGTERGVYRSGRDEYLWDYGENQLTIVTGAGDPAQQLVRLPRAADLTPPELGRRLLAAAAGDPVSGLPARRVAGIAAAGLRITPVDPQTTVGYVDVWADPGTGLPLQVEITGRGTTRPILATRFLEVSLTAPAAGVLTAPAPRAGIGFTVTRTPDLLSALRRVNPGQLPDTLAGQPRRSVTPGAPVGIYGTGLAQYAVLALPGRLGNGAFENAVRWGRRLTLTSGDAGLVTTALLSLMVVRSTGTGQAYLVAGPVGAPLLEQIAGQLAGFS